jgi:ubiquinone/menaquinone biosynthesis C-methylase UbiE
MSQRKYLETIYHDNSRPITDYPKKLINYLIRRFDLKKNSKILELGCGRGEFLNEFHLSGLNAYGVDISDFETVDIDKEKLPYKDNFFDIIYSKSVIEHFYYPDKIFEEAYRVLKPGGLIITLTPEWKYIYKSFYEDFTHRVPFTKVSLKDIHEMNDFKNVRVESFKQLPVIFEKKYYSIFFDIFSFFTRILVPDHFRLKYKWIRFSKEIMLLSIAEK